VQGCGITTWPPKPVTPPERRLPLKSCGFGLTQFLSENRFIGVTLEVIDEAVTAYVEEVISGLFNVTGVCVER
jgi:hypothetical protein